MKKMMFMPALLCLLLVSCNSPQGEKQILTDLQGNTENNYLFDDQPTAELGQPALRIYGEIAEELVVDPQAYPVHNLVVKETLQEGGERVFKGTFRYDGISLEDLLTNVKLQKKSGFNPLTDLYVKVHAADGSYAVFSWAEIFFPVHHHQQLIAFRVSRHIPFKTPDVRYPLPEKVKLVVGNDIITCRNISEPVGIEVCSYVGDFVEKKMEKLYWPTLTLAGFGQGESVLDALPADLPMRESDLVFYGRGRGIHGVEPFEGPYLSDFLNSVYDFSVDELREGMLVTSSADGYRSVFSLSEIINRNDRLETLIMDKDNYEDAGKFSLLVTGDFYSDRAMKALWRIEFLKGI